MLTTAVPQPSLKQANNTSLRIIHVVTALLAGVAASLISLLGCSALLCRVDLPSYMLIPLGTISICIGSATGGLLLAHAEKKNGMVWGILCGIFFFIACFGVAFLCGQRKIGSLTIIRMVAFVLSGAIGGYLGLILSERSMHHRIKRD